MRIRMLLAAGVTACLSACAQLVSSAAPAPSLCPPLVSYTAQEQVQAASALETLEEGHILVRMMVDYGALRAALQTCQS